MTNQEAKLDPRVLAIRDDALVGRGSCSTIDECYDAIDLVRALDMMEISDPLAAVAWAREEEGVQMDRMMDQRFGDDDDVQVDIYREWQERKKEAAR